jgi:hypothetical protein
MVCAALSAANPGESMQKQFQARAKSPVKEAKGLEKAGRPAEARKEYAQSEAVFETKDAAKGIKRVDEKLQQQVRTTLAQAQKLYTAGQFRQAADQLEQAVQLETFTPVPLTPGVDRRKAVLG